MAQNIDTDVIEVASLTILTWLSIEFYGIIAGVIFGTISSSFIIWKWSAGKKEHKNTLKIQALQIKKLQKDLGEDAGQETDDGSDADQKRNSKDKKD